MAKTSKNTKNSDSRELLEALTILEKEKNISKETLLEAIENHHSKELSDNCYLEIIKKCDNNN